MRSENPFGCNHERMAGWLCTECGRRFGRTRQSHVCEPAASLEDWLASRPTSERRAAEAVLQHLRKLGPIVVEAVSVGILVKRARTFVEMRPKGDRLALSFLLSSALVSPRIVRTIRTSAHRVAQFVDLRSVTDVDDELRSWLAESYLASA